MGQDANYARIGGLDEVLKFNEVISIVLKLPQDRFNLEQNFKFGPNFGTKYYFSATSRLDNYDQTCSNFSSSLILYIYY